MKNYDAKDVSINIGGQEIYGFGLAEVLHIKACKVAKLKKTHNGK